MLVQFGSENLNHIKPAVFDIDSHCLYSETILPSLPVLKNVLLQVAMQKCASKRGSWILLPAAII